MLFSDILFITQWWFMFFVIGIFFFPFTARLFSHFTDRGYMFSKVIGLVIISYTIFVLGITHLLPFTRIASISVALVVGSLFFIRGPSMKAIAKTSWKVLLVEECIFLLTLFFWSYIRIHQPDIHGLEKYMDFGFVNTIGRSTYFPPKDMWFTPLSINYYFFGHFMTAVLTKLSGIPSFITYNLMMATLFAFTFTLSYALITNIIFILKSTIQPGKITTKTALFTFFSGIITAALVSLGGNLHVLYIFFTPYKNENPLPFSSLSLALQSIPNAYWYPNATRFIYNTIHEFPLYSFVVSDLHGHVLSIPIILTIIAFLLQIFLSRQIKSAHLIFVAFLLSCAYMTNAWDGAIYFLLTILVILSLQIGELFSNKRKNIGSFLLNSIYYVMIVLAGFFLFSLPFSLFFQTGAIVHGIGVLCAPEFLTNLKQIGPFIFETDHCQKSPFWQLLILYGFFYFFVLSFFIFLSRLKKVVQMDMFILMLIALSSLLILIPEFFYMKDIYPAHYRANTMFKLTYEAFIMLSLTSGYCIFRLISNLSHIKTLFGKISMGMFIMITVILCVLVLLYPSFAINSYYENLTNKKSLDGISYLKQIHPDDYAAIQWINKNISGQPIIAEAQGDSYTDYARISANTGLPTILGWTVHEWLWRGSYDIPAPRISEIQTLYETDKPSTAKGILQKYAVSYVYVGDLEREKYPKLSEEKFQKFGTIVYKKNRTIIYEIR